jgi:hypothetical protein
MSTPYAMIVQHVILDVLKLLVDVPSPIGADALRGVIRNVSRTYDDAPLDEITLSTMLEGYGPFLRASAVHPDDEVTPGVTYRNLGYLTIVGDIKYGWAPAIRQFVRMDLTNVRAPI